MTDELRELVIDDLPFTLALKAESPMVGKEIIQFWGVSKKTMKQHFYIGGNSKKETMDPMGVQATTEGLIPIVEIGSTDIEDSEVFESELESSNES